MLVDDHAIVRQGLRSVLEREPAVRDRRRGLERAPRRSPSSRHQRPTIVLLDLKLSAGSDVAGLVLCGQLTARAPAPGVLVVTTFLDEDLVLEAIRHGARGYVLKDVDAVSLVARASGPCTGERARSTATARRWVRGAPAARARPPSPPPPTSPPVARDVLRPARPRRCPTAPIGRELYISATTAKFHVGNLMRKLSVSRRAEAVYQAGDRGSPADGAVGPVVVVLVQPAR